MTTFWVIASAMVVLAMAFLLPPLFGTRSRRTADRVSLNTTLFKDQLAELEKDLKNGELQAEQFAAARADLEKELLYDLSGSNDSGEPVKHKSGRWAAAVLLVAVPVASLGLYLELGASKLVPVLLASGPQEDAKTASHPSAMQTSAPPVDEMIVELAERLEANPDDAKGWQMLARSYLFTRSYEKAVEAFEHAYRLLGDDADLLTNYAEALALANGNQISERPTDLLQRALEVRPSHEKALWLRGLAHYQGGEFAQAIARWEQLAAVFPEDSQEANQIQVSIAKAREHLGMGAVQDVPVGSAVAATAAASRDKDSAAQESAASVTVRVELDEGVAGQAAPDDTVFIFARAASGPKMPLAIVRKKVADLPITATLNDSMAMMPAMKLSKFPQVAVGARVSKSGNAMPQSGDLQGLVSPVTPGAEDTILVQIDNVVP